MILLGVHGSCGKTARTAREDFAAPEQFDRVPRVRRRVAAILETAFRVPTNAGARTSRFRPAALRGRSDVALVPRSPGSLHHDPSSLSDLTENGFKMAIIVHFKGIY